MLILVFRWSLIAKRVPGRTDNQVKNYWNTHLSKKLGLKKQNSHLGHVSGLTKSMAGIVSDSSKAIEDEVSIGSQKLDEASDSQESVMSQSYVNTFWESDSILELSSLDGILGWNSFDFA